MNAAMYPRVVILPRHGLGQTDSAGNPIFIDATTGLPTTAYDTSTSPPAAPAFSWTSFLNTLVGQAGATARASIAPLSVLPPGSSYFQSPYGTAVGVGTGAANLAAQQIGLQSLTSSLTGMLPILLIVGGVILVISMVGGKK